MNHRDRQIICGFFLSKYDHEGLSYLGFDTFTEAFNALGFSLHARPASIKNYRDEIDPYFPNERRGWHKRPLREHCSRIMTDYANLDLIQLGELIKSFLIPSRSIKDFPELRTILDLDGSNSSFAKRLITGKAAEEYFLMNVSKMADFSGMEIINTTNWGCGFDFKLTNPDGRIYAIEVKGMKTRCGQIQLTEMEHDVAGVLRDKFYLVVVRNFIEMPFHSIIRNPLNSPLPFTKVERQEVRRSWCANVNE